MQEQKKATDADEETKEEIDSEDEASYSCQPLYTRTLLSIKFPKSSAHEVDEDMTVEEAEEMPVPITTAP